MCSKASVDPGFLCRKASARVSHVLITAERKKGERDEGPHRLGGGTGRIRMCPRDLHWPGRRWGLLCANLITGRRACSRHSEWQRRSCGRTSFSKVLSPGVPSRTAHSAPLCMSQMRAPRGRLSKLRNPRAVIVLHRPRFASQVHPLQVRL